MTWNSHRFLRTILSRRPSEPAPAGWPSRPSASLGRNYFEFRNRINIRKFPLQMSVNPMTMNVHQNRVREMHTKMMGRRITTCNEIISQCIAPQFNYCQKLCGIQTMFCGTGLCCCCCYGCHRIDCPSVCCAGSWLCLTSPCLYGIFISVIVGCRMCRMSPAS